MNTRPPRRHEVTVECAGVHCHYHGVDEWSELADSIVCGECGHVFSNGDELRRITRERWGGPEWPEVYACAYCTHDLTDDL